MLHKKDKGSSKNGRDSNPEMPRRKVLRRAVVTMPVLS